MKTPLGTFAAFVLVTLATQPALCQSTESPKSTSQPAISETTPAKSVPTRSMSAEDLDKKIQSEEKAITERRNKIEQELTRRRSTRLGCRMGRNVLHR